MCDIPEIRLNERSKHNERNEPDPSNQLNQPDQPDQPNAPVYQDAESSAGDFARALLCWHAANARDLPWRGERDPYRIVLSEFMLQQTRVETVKGYYARFLEAFPDVTALADAPEQRVLKLWEGLGYYSRARNLHKAARVVARDFAGSFPHSVAGLRELPGIGEYTAGAVASMAFGLREPALDGNCVRVLARVLNIREDCQKPAVRAALTLRARALMPEREPGEYNQALMGLGALVCTPASPRCGECPVARYCAIRDCAIRDCGDPGQLPVKPPKPARRVESVCVALIECEGRVLVRRRAQKLLHGLWELPTFVGCDCEAALREALDELGLTPAEAQPMGEAKHIFTHIEWRMQGFLFHVSERAPVEGCVWADADMRAEMAFPTALRAYTNVMRALSRATGDEAGRETRDETGREARRETRRKTRDETGREARRETGREMGDETGREARRETGRETRDETGREARRETRRKTRDETGREARRETRRETGRETGDESGREVGREARRETGREVRGE